MSIDKYQSCYILYTKCSKILSEMLYWSNAVAMRVTTLTRNLEFDLLIVYYIGPLLLIDVLIGICIHSVVFIDLSESPAIYECIFYRFLSYLLIVVTASWCVSESFNSLFMKFMIILFSFWLKSVFKLYFNAVYYNRY
jgi:hypothetical protein